MMLLAIVPIILSFLLLAAHCFRAGHPVFMGLSLLWPLLLLIRKAWAVRLVQVALLAGAAEWLRTGVAFSMGRMGSGAPFLRLALILGAVALFTGAASLVFLLPSLRQRYGMRLR